MSSEEDKNEVENLEITLLHIIQKPITETHVQNVLKETFLNMPDVRVSKRNTLYICYRYHVPLRLTGSYQESNRVFEGSTMRGIKYAFMTFHLQSKN